VVFDPPTSDEVDGLRRALGDTRRARIAPHITLVPPVNLPGAELPAALRVLRQAASAATGPLRLSLGPVNTFAPATNVLYLEVGGDLEELRRLRDRSAQAPLDRRDERPWVPHVTIAGDVAATRIDAAIDLLDRYAAVASVDRVVLLSESDRRWRPLADAVLGAIGVVGRGGLAVELTEGRLVDPEAAAALAGDFVRDRGSDPVPPAADPSTWAPGAHRSLVVTARREGGVVGAARAWVDDDGGHVGVLVSAEHRRQGIGSHLLAAAEAAVARQGWESASLQPLGPPAFFRARGR
jgi:2'-5' RNA ligase/GNAT superfamily N-acetyltransferase